MFKYIYGFLDKVKSNLSEKGQGMVEYALILAFVAGIAFVALTGSGNDSLGIRIKNAFLKAGTQIDTAAGEAPTE